MRQAFFDVLMAVSEEQDDVWLLTADLGFSVLEPFQEKFPDRFINVGVAEQNLAGMAAGLALSGKCVVMYSIANFVTLRCFEQIRNDIGYHDANVKIVGVGGGFAYGTQGHTHHGLEDLSLLRTLAPLDVVAPADPAETRWVTRTVLDTNRPCYMRLARAGERNLHDHDIKRERGDVIVCRDGEDALIATTGTLLGEALSAAETLSVNNRSVAVWSVPWLRPFDSALFADAARRYSIILTAEEGVATGGLGAAVASIIAGLDTPRARHILAAVDERPVPASLSESAARKHFKLDAKGLASRINTALA